MDDERALNRAAEVYGISRDEPGADEHLRRTSVYAWAALRFACLDLWGEIKWRISKWF